MKRTRIYINPETEVPKLEEWFTNDKYPSTTNLYIYLEELNKSEFRQKFPLQYKNMKSWFQNRRMKVKNAAPMVEDKHIENTFDSDTTKGTENSTKNGK